MAALAHSLLNQELELEQQNVVVVGVKLAVSSVEIVVAVVEAVYFVDVVGSLVVVVVKLAVPAVEMFAVVAEVQAVYTVAFLAVVEMFADV